MRSGHWISRRRSRCPDRADARESRCDFGGGPVQQERHCRLDVDVFRYRTLQTGGRDLREMDAPARDDPPARVQRLRVEESAGGAPWFRSMPLPRSPKPRARLTHVSSISLLDTDKRIFPEARASPPPPRAKDRRPQLNPLFAQNLAHIFFIISAEAATVRPREGDRPRAVSKTMRIG